MSPAVGAAVMAAISVLIPTPAARAAPGGAIRLSGGTATGRGMFATYTDRDTVLDGGTVAAPDVGAPVADTSVDLTGLGSALAALGYSPYNDAPGVVNAFGGTNLPLATIGDRTRAKVTGRPPQESSAGLGGPSAQAHARLSAGPTAQALTSGAGTAVGTASVSAGDVRAAVVTVNRTADATVSVVLRSVSVGPNLRIDSVVLTARAVADGVTGFADASVTVEGVTLDGTPVRLTPAGFQPIGVAPPDLSVLTTNGVEVVGAGHATAEPGREHAEARATGPRFRLRTADGRLATVVLGQVDVTSNNVAGGRQA